MSERRNRRNYYRILHVQPDAPAAVLKSSYRALMLSLEMHPDRGGDHWNAALVNEAYAVLSDEKKRAEYDLTIDLTPGRGTGGTRGAAASAADTTDAGSPTTGRPGTGSTGWPDDDDAVESNCLFCGTQRWPGPLSTATRCHTCRSPLTPAGAPHLEETGRRAAKRVAAEGRVGFYLSWPQPAPFEGRIVDLSPRGMQFESSAPIRQFRIIKIDGELVDAVGRIASCRERDGMFAVGIEFYTVYFHQARGTFVSTDA